MHEVLDVDLLLVHGESLLTPQALVFGGVPGLLGREVPLHQVEVQVLGSVVRRQRVISAKFAQEFAATVATTLLQSAGTGKGIRL